MTLTATMQRLANTPAANLKTTPRDRSGADLPYASLPMTSPGIERYTSAMTEALDPNRLFASIAGDLERVGELYDRELTSDVPLVAEMVRHIGGFRGKMLRPALVLLVGRAVGEGRLNRTHYILGAVVEMVHVATLVHDDVLDESRLRRGRPTVNQRWGNEAAVLLGDFLISHAYHLCSKVPDTEAARLVGAATNTVCEGELLQMAHRGDRRLSEADYFEIIRRKTGCLTGLSARLGAWAAGADADLCQALETYGTNLGMAFQIADDLLDLTGETATVGKSLGTDLLKGRMTLPLIHLMGCLAAEDATTLRDQLTDDPLSHLEKLRGHLVRHGSLDYATTVAQQRVRLATTALASLPAGPARDLLEMTAHFSIHRGR